MRRVLVLGAGTAGTTLVNRLRSRLDRREWQITVVDRDLDHHYQPGYLFIPFGRLRPSQVTKPRERFIPHGVALVTADVEQVDVDAHQVVLDDGTVLAYDLLVIASGTSPRPEMTPGVTDGEWRRSVFDFYTLDGAVALRDALAGFRGGRLVVHLTELPIKCPVAPLEFAFLADDHLRRAGLRDRTELTLVTPLDGAFTKPVAAERLGSLLAERDIRIEPDFVTERLDAPSRSLVSYDEREVGFDLLVTIPVNAGADFVARSGLGDDLQHVRVDPHTLRSVASDDVFAVGDAADLPTSKAGSTAHYAVDVLTENLVAIANGEPPPARFDGHANCFVETGGGKGLLLDFNYDTQPLPGAYPVPRVGPFPLLAESARNHWGKLAFRWAYWHVLLPGRPMGLPAAMSMTGKVPEPV